MFACLVRFFSQAFGMGSELAFISHSSDVKLGACATPTRTPTLMDLCGHSYMAISKYLGAILKKKSQVPGTHISGKAGAVPILQMRTLRSGGSSAV